MSLGNHILVFQADRQLLSVLLQQRTLISGIAPIAPFRLRLPPPPKTPNSLVKPQSPLDLIFKSADLELTPGTNTGSLVLNIHAGIVRLPNSPALPMQGGRVKVAFQFENARFFAVKWTGAILEPPSVPNIPNFAMLANAEVSRFLTGTLNMVFPLFDDLPPQFASAILISQSRVVDPNTVAVMVGGGDPDAVTRFLSPSSQVAGGVSAAYLRGTQLCRSLLRPAERDPAWNSTMFGPTALERTRLPKGDCGDGELSRGKDDVDVKITETIFVFRKGYIDISGKFNAGDTCWSVTDGRFSQRLFFDFNNVTGQITPRLEPPEPVLDYDVSLDFLCELAAFSIGLLTPVIGSALLGLGAVIAANIAAESFKPKMDSTQVAAFPIPPIPGVRWMDIAIDPEGMIFQGSMTVTLPAGDSKPLVWIKVTPQPQDVQPGRAGEVEYAPPMCPPRVFEYHSFTQNDQKLLQAAHQWLIEPLQYEWYVNTQPLPPGEKGALPLTTTVRTALPPPDGVDVAGFEVQLGYDTGYQFLAASTNPNEIILTARAEDLNYSVSVELRVSDALQRSFSFPVALSFRGDYVTFGQDYYDYLNECFKKLQDYMDQKGKKMRRPKPGEPQTGLDKYVQFALEHITAGNPEVSEFLPGLVKAYGLAAVNQAIAAKALKKTLI